MIRKNVTRGIVLKIIRPFPAPEFKKGNENQRENDFGKMHRLPFRIREFF